MRSVPKSKLLLLELVCDFVIFALCAAVCVAVLLRVRSMSRESTMLTQAVYIAQDAAERCRAGEPLPMYGFYRADGTPDPSTLDLELRSSLPDYVVELTEGAEGAQVSVYPYDRSGARDEAVYTLTVGRGAEP